MKKPERHPKTCKVGLQTPEERPNFAVLSIVSNLLNFSIAYRLKGYK